MPTVGKGKNKVKKQIVFSTYDQLSIQFLKKGTDIPAHRRRFFTQLVASEKVVLIMDEAHNAGGSGDLYNLSPDSKTDIVSHPRALFLRQLIPNADGVIYSSATYAKNPQVMDLYSATDLRLGVKGDMQALADTITASGIPFQQITAGMLTQAGQYIRRERSFDGVTYTPKVLDVDTRIAENVSGAMSIIRKFEEEHIESMLGEDEEAQGQASMGARGEQTQSFTSLMHNIIDQMRLSLKVAPALPPAITPPNNPPAPVITPQLVQNPAGPSAPCSLSPAMHQLSPGLQRISSVPTENLTCPETRYPDCSWGWLCCSHAKRYLTFVHILPYTFYRTLFPEIITPA